MNRWFERAIELLQYDAGSGLFIRKISAGGQKSGSIAGRPNTNRHIQISIDNKRVMAHHLAWWWMTGEWPIELIDHKDGNPSNNKWANLRKANFVTNQQNRKCGVNNKLGVKGVYKKKGRFCAAISVNKQKIHLGYFRTSDEASTAYKKAETEYFGEFARNVS